MSIRIVGTRALDIASTSTWFESPPANAHGAVLIAAYWDDTASDFAAEISHHLNDGPVRLLLWINGGTGLHAWERLEELNGSDFAEVRFVNNPSRGGIFHVKANGLTDEQGVWLHAYLGSANLTDNAYTKNVELGAVFSEPAALLSLQAWFEDLWNSATPFTSDLYDETMPIVAENAEASRAARDTQRTVSVDLVPPAPAPPPVPRGGTNRAATSPPAEKKWWKKMSASDAAQYSAVANPQSMITLTRVRGKIVDPDEFFHSNFFVEAWEADPDFPGREKLVIEARVKILDADHGTQSVRFTWDANRRENQHGPATHLHLQPNLEELFQQQILTGKYVVLSSGTAGYLIEVVEDEPTS